MRKFANVDFFNQHQNYILSILFEVNSCPLLVHCKNEPHFIVKVCLHFHSEYHNSSGRKKSLLYVTGVVKNFTIMDTEIILSFYLAVLIKTRI